MRGLPILSCLPVILLAVACGREAPGTGGAGDGASPLVLGRVNLVLISLDPCRADRLGCYGGTRDLTPNLDALAAESVLFADCLAASTLTAPSHRSIFTGQSVRRHGITANGRAALSPYNLAELLQEAGWKTAGFVGGPPISKYDGFGQGFDVYEQATLSRHASTVGLVRFSVTGALSWLQEQAEEPFFLFVHGFDPHCPYQPPAEQRGRYDAWYQGDFDPGTGCGMRDFGKALRSGEIGPEEKRLVADLYDEEVAAADQEIGRLLEELRRRGLLDRSIVVFLSDHGESLGEHDWIGHAHTWEEQLRVPLLIRLPHGEHAGVLQEPVQHVDLAPTLLGLLGLESPEGVEGVDLRPLLLGQPVAGLADRMRVSRSSRQVSVRFGERWKLAFRWAGKEVEDLRLYDLLEDPGEERDLVASPEGRARAEELLERYRRYVQEQEGLDRRMRARMVSLQMSPEEARRQYEQLQALGYVGGDEEEEGGGR